MTRKPLCRVKLLFYLVVVLDPDDCTLVGGKFLVSMLLVGPRQGS